MYSTYPRVRTGLLTYSPAYSIEVAVEEAMLEVDLSEATIEEVIAETIVESNAIVEAIEEAIEEAFPLEPPTLQQRSSLDLSKVIDLTQVGREASPAGRLSLAALLHAAPPPLPADLARMFD